jgi:hypothetical protein
VALCAVTFCYEARERYIRFVLRSFVVRKLSLSIKYYLLQKRMFQQRPKHVALIFGKINGLHNYKSELMGR